MSHTHHHFSDLTSENPWSETLDHCFKDCIQSLWPSVYPTIDWAQPKELIKQMSVSEHTDNSQDKDFIYRVQTVDNTSILLWLQLNSTEEASHTFSKPLFEKFYQLYQEYNEVVLPLIIFTNAPVNKEIHQYQLRVADQAVCQFTFEPAFFRTWDGQINHLLQSPNPFEKIIGVYLTNQSTKKEAETIYQERLSLHRTLLDTTDSKEEFLLCYTFMDTIMPLSESFNQRYHEEIYQLERNAKVDYLTHNANYGVDKWKKRGFEQGKQQMQLEVLKKMLGEGIIDRDCMKRVLGLNNISDKEFNRLLIQVSDEETPVRSDTDAINHELQTI